MSDRANSSKNGTQLGFVGKRSDSKTPNNENNGNPGQIQEHPNSKTATEGMGQPKI